MRFSLFNKRRIYADWAATTSLHPRVEKAMKEARKAWANPSAIYTEGVEAKKALEEGRARSARLLGVRPEEVYFTSGGTEANATIIQGVLRTRLEKEVDSRLRGNDKGDVHVVASAIEHSSIRETLALFEKRGVKVTYVNPDKNGIVSADEVIKAITPATALVTVMYANNEIGTIQPVSKIGAGIRKIRAEKMGVDPGLPYRNGPLVGSEKSSTSLAEWVPSHSSGREDGGEFPIFHVDASQAPLWLSCEIEGLRADAMTLDAHKMQGPKGVGALVIRRHVAWEPLMAGGGQERGKRSTTESLELVSGFAEALRIAQEGRKERSRKALAIREYFTKRLAEDVPGAVINGSLDKRLPNNLNISLPRLSDPELAVLYLDREGIACSTKSSCLKGEEESYVVKSLGGDPWRAKNTIRFSLAPETGRRDVERIVRVLRDLPESLTRVI